MTLKSIHNIKTSAFLFAFLAFAVTSFSQTPKGLVVTGKEDITQGTTRALIIGISKYEYIDTLQYADRDAQVFADYLKQANFWGINKDDITLLINDKAKNGDMITQLARIAQISKPGDNLLFYFSGHGDVETITQFNNGYLLAYDTYSNNYIAGALPISFLKELFVTLLNKDVKVILVTDACRSGKLAGGMKGAEFAASAISNMWKNEIKILSSQPGQLSYEDKKWGNGRGVFSYYLINGLNGDADANKDSTITLSELEMYVGSNVARETGNKQQPIFEGPNKYSNVLTKIKAASQKPLQKNGGNSFQKRQKRIQLTEDSSSYYYQQMNAAIENKKFDSKERGSATFFYRQLKRYSKDPSITIQANSALLAALMNSSQEIVNNSFIGKNLVSEEEFEQGIDLIDQVLQNNDLQLPYNAHLMNLKRYLYVLGKATWADSTDTGQLTSIIDSAMKEEPDAAYLLTASGAVEMEKENWEKAIVLLEKAVQKSPGWLIPKYQLGSCYGHTKSYRKALNYYEEVLTKDSTYRTFECTKCILERMADYAIKTKQEKKAVNYRLKSIDLFPQYFPPYDALYDYAADKKDKVVATELINRLIRYDTIASFKLIRIRLENEVLERPFSISSLDSVKGILRTKEDTIEYNYTMGLFFTSTDNFDSDSAYYYLRTATTMDSTDVFYLIGFTSFLSKEVSNEEAQELLARKIKEFNGEDKAYLQQELAYSYYDTGQYKEAFEVFKELVTAGFLYCSDLRKMKKVFKGIAGYETYMKTCKDNEPAEQ